MTTPDIKPVQLTVRQVVQATIGVLLVAAAFFLLYRFHQVFLIFFLAIVLSTAIRPIVRYLDQHGIPKEVGLILVFVLLVLVIAAVLLLVLPVVIEQANLVIDTIPETYQEVRERMLEHPNFFVWRIANELPARINLGPNPEPVEGEQAVIENVGQNLQLIGTGARAIFFTISALALAFYWTLDGRKNKTALLMLVPRNNRESVRELTNEIQTKLGAYVQGQALLAFIIGTLSFIAYALIGLPNTLGLAIVAGLMETVPIVGPFLGAVPALLLAYAVDPNKVIWVIIATIIIQQMENNLIVPRVMRRAVGVNPLVTLMALSAFGALFGVLGAVVALPIAAIIQLLLDHFVIEPDVLEENPVAGRDEASVLRYEVQELTRDIRKSIREKEADPDEEVDLVEDNLETVAADLDSALAEFSDDNNSNQGGRYH